MLFQVSSFTGGFVFQPRNPGEAWSSVPCSRAAPGAVFGLGRIFLLLFCLKQAARSWEALFIIKGWLCGRDNPTHTFFPGQNKPSGRKWQQAPPPAPSPSNTPARIKLTWIFLGRFLRRHNKPKALQQNLPGKQTVVFSPALASPMPRPPSQGTTGSSAHGVAGLSCPLALTDLASHKQASTLPMETHGLCNSLTTYFILSPCSGFSMSSFSLPGLQRGSLELQAGDGWQLWVALLDPGTLTALQTWGPTLPAARPQAALLPKATQGQTGDVP